MNRRLASATIALVSAACGCAPGADCIIGTAPYTPDEHGRIVLPGATTLRVMPQYNGVRDDGTPFSVDKVTIVLQDAGNRFWPVVARLTDAEASRLLSELDAAIEQRQGDWQDGAPGVDASIYTRAYNVTETGTLELPDRLRLRALPMYRGTDAAGRTVIDKRLTLVLDDTAKGFWSAIVWLDEPSAVDLRAQIVRTMARRIQRSGD
ncbi:MAG: hypothetical protein AAF356_07455 [Planctomycetota bacterium]